MGRVKTYEAIVKGHNVPTPGVPESFKVLVKELQSLGLDIRVLDKNMEEIELITDDDDDNYEKVLREDSYGSARDFEDAGFGIENENGEMESAEPSDEDDSESANDDFDFESVVAEELGDLSNEN